MVCILLPFWFRPGEMIWWFKTRESWNSATGNVDCKMTTILSWPQCVNQRAETLRYLLWNHWGEFSLQWRHNERDGISNHQSHDCLLNRLFRRRSEKTIKLCFTGLCAGNSPETGEFPIQRASNAENVPFDDVIVQLNKTHAVPSPKISRLWKGSPLYAACPMLVLVRARISNYIHYKVWDEITYPFSNLNCAVLEVWERLSNFRHLYWAGDNLPKLGLNYISVSKSVQVTQRIEVYLGRSFSSHYDVQHVWIFDETNFRRNISFLFFSVAFWTPILGSVSPTLKMS